MGRKGRVKREAEQLKKLDARLQEGNLDPEEKRQAEIKAETLRWLRANSSKKRRARKDVYKDTCSRVFGFGHMFSAPAEQSGSSSSSSAAVAAPMPDQPTPKTMPRPKPSRRPESAAVSSPPWRTSASKSTPVPAPTRFLKEWAEVEEKKRRCLKCSFIQSGKRRKRRKRKKKVQL